MGLLAQRLAATSASQGPSALTPIPDYVSPSNFDDRTGTGLMGFIGNFGADVKDIAQGLQRLGGMAIGDVRDIATGNFEDVDVLTPTFIPTLVEGFASDIADRYGEPSEIPQQMYEHPLSFLADALTVAGGAGAAARASAGVGRWGDIAARVGGPALSREAQMARAASVQAYRGAKATLAEMQVPRRMLLGDEASRLQSARAGLMDMVTGRQAPIPSASMQGPLLADGSFTTVSKLAQAAAQQADVVKAFPTGVKALDRLLPAGQHWIPRHQSIFGRSREGFDWIETRTAEATSGYTRGLWGSRNPLVQAVWTNPVQRRLLTESRARFADELLNMRRRAAMGEKVSPYEIESRTAALARMDAGAAERVSRYALYGHFLSKVDVDRFIGRLVTDGIISRRDQAEQLGRIMKGAEGAEMFHDVMQGLAGERRIAYIPDDILGESLSRKGYSGTDAFERAVRDILYQTDAGNQFTVDEKSTLIDKVLRGNIVLNEAFKLQDAPDLAPDVAPQRARFRDELRNVGDRVGMPSSQQDFFVALTDSMARALRARDPERYPSVDSVYEKMGIEFAQKWVEGIENSLQQRVGRLYRGAIEYVDGKPQVNARRLARWFWKGKADNPDLVNWYENGSNLVAELTQGLRTTFRDADGNIIETVDDYELLTDLLAAHSQGTSVVRNFSEAWEVYTRFKTGRIRLEHSDFEGWVPEGQKTANLMTQKISPDPLRRFIEEEGRVAYSALTENEQRSIQRAFATGEISVKMADEAAVKLGVHPARIWGDEFYADLKMRGPKKIRAFDENDVELKLFSGGSTGQEKAGMVAEILSGHLIRHWETEIADGLVRDLPVEEVLRRFDHRGTKAAKGLDLSHRQKVRAFAANLKLDGDRATLDRRMGILFGIFTGEREWKAAIGRNARGYGVPPRFNRSSLQKGEYGKVEAWLRQVQDHINRHLPAGDAPYSLAQVQSVLWGQAVSFAQSEAGRVAKLLRKGIDTDGSPLTPNSRAALEEYHRLLRAAVTVEGEDPSDYVAGWAAIADGPLGEQMVQQIRSRYGETTAFLAQRVTDIVKGQIIFGDSFPATIQMFAEGDFTTLVHEGGHLLRRLLPEEDVVEIWRSYRDLVHGDAPIPDDGGRPLRQTVRSMEPRGAFAAVDAPGGEIAEGQFVRMGPDTVRVVRLYQKGERFYAEVQNHATGTVKKDVPVESVEIVPELDPYLHGFSGPLGVPAVEGGKVGVVKGSRESVASGTGAGARYERYVGKKGTLTAENAPRPFFDYTEEGKAARAAWEAAHKDDVQEIRAAVRVDTTGGTPKYEIVPAALKDNRWVDARTLVGDPVPQPRPEPTDILPEVEYREVTPVTEGMPELAKTLGADPIAQDLLRHFKGEDTLEKWAEGGKIKFTTIGESPGYFLIRQDTGAEVGKKDNYYVVNKSLWDDPNQALSPDEHLVKDEMSGQTAWTKRPQAPDSARWAKPGSPALKKGQQAPKVRRTVPKAEPAPEVEPLPRVEVPDDDPEVDELIQEWREGGVQAYGNVKLKKDGKPASAKGMAEARAEARKQIAESRAREERMRQRPNPAAIAEERSRALHPEYDTMTPEERASAAVRRDVQAEDLNRVMEGEPEGIDKADLAELVPDLMASYLYVDNPDPADVKRVLRVDYGIELDDAEVDWLVGEMRRRKAAAVGRDVQAEQAARGGLDEAEEAAAQDEFAARLAAEAEAAEKAQILRDQGLEVDEAQLAEEIAARSAAPVSPGDQARAPEGGPPPSGSPPGAPPSGGNKMPWSVAMEEAFAEDLERWVFNQLLPTDERVHMGFRTLSTALRELWQKVRGFALERQMVPEVSAQVFDRYFGQAITDAAQPDPNWTLGFKRRTRSLRNVAPIDHPAVGAQVAQIEADAQALHHLARQAETPLRRRLATVFNYADFWTGKKDAAGIGWKLQHGIPVTDALRARVRIDTWTKAREAISKIEASGLRILGVEDTLAEPGAFGSRALRVLVEDPDSPGFVSEIEIGTPGYEWFRRATWMHEQQARRLPVMLAELEERMAKVEQQIADVVSHGDPETDTPILRSLEKQQLEMVEEHATLTEETQASERIMEGLYEMVVDEIDAHHGGALPGGKERQAINELRLWNAEHVEQPLLASNFGKMRFMFERLWYPIRKKAGAEFQEVEGPNGKVTDELVGGGDPYALDEDFARRGLPQPVYFPHMKPPPKLSDFVLQRGRTMFGARKLAENKNLKRWRGQLMEEDAFGDPGYLTDVEMAYRLRAARAIKMRDTQRLVNWVTQNFGRKIADPNALAPGEVLYAPDFINALFRAVVTLEDQMATMLANLPTELLIGGDFTKKEGAEAAFAVIEAGLKRQGVQEVQAGALMAALEEVMPKIKREFVALTSRGVDYYAIPKVVAKRLEQSVSGPLGLAGNKSLRLFWDGPTNLWRAIVLYGRPAWLVNNFFGNLVFLKIQGGRFSDVVRQRFDPEFKDMLQQMAKDLPGTEVGFFTSTAEQYTPLLGSAGEGGVGEAMAAAKVAARENRALRPAYTFGDAMKSLNQEMENYFRRAGMARAIETEINPDHIRRLGRRFWADKKEMERVLIDGIPDEAVERILDKVNTFFGDFSQMSPAERHIMRRFIFPFWGFYRHVVKLFLQLPSEYPGRFTVMRAIAATTEDMIAEYGPMPEWMAGMATFGGEPLPEGDTRFVSTAGPNPFNVLSDDVVSMLHPAIKIWLERQTGRDAFTGRPFSSPDVVTPYGSDQQFRIVRDANGMPIEAEPVSKVVPPLGVQVLSQVPQYDLIRNLMAGGRAYDTEGLVASATGGPVINSRGEVVRPVGPVETVAKYLGFSTFPFDVPSYQERFGQERENALAYALRQWKAEQGG